MIDDLVSNLALNLKNYFSNTNIFILIELPLI
jgi:hypothetical protein